MDNGKEEAAADGKRLILGLGNPGPRYRDTRHNLGFWVVEILLRRLGLRRMAPECQALVTASDEVMLAMPQTFMNRSGYAARCLVERHGFAPHEILVIFDDVQLPLGRLRLRPGGSQGGHRGMESVIENLRTDRIPRLRLGIRSEEEPPEGEALVDFVLSPFDDEELETVEDMVVRAADAAQAWLEGSIEDAMNLYNR